MGGDFNQPDAVVLGFLRKWDLRPSEAAKLHDSLVNTTLGVPPEAPPPLPQLESSVADEKRLVTTPSPSPMAEDDAA